MKKHPLLAAGAAAGTAVLGAAYAVYRVAFYQKPTTKVPSPADMPTRECYRKAMGPDADALARDMFKAVHITAQDGVRGRMLPHFSARRTRRWQSSSTATAAMRSGTAWAAIRCVRRWATMCCCLTSAPTATAAAIRSRWA